MNYPQNQNCMILNLCEHILRREHEIQGNMEWAKGLCYHLVVMTITFQESSTLYQAPECLTYLVA
jgi:hypothetical protein